MINFDVHDPAIRQKISLALRGNKHRQGKPAWNKGMKMSDDFRRKISEVMQGQRFGEKHWNWKGGRPKRKPGVRKLKLRFLTLARDKFTCQYCGKRPPEVSLEVDHRFPKSKGGVDDINNFVTACKDCNLGKRDIILTEFIDTESTTMNWGTRLSPE